ncbi:hypothetical protein OFR95_14780 [Brachyspira hyodysenteriae]|nr:hypothetical protein [Brachyspira hyodysenteriae]
MVQSYKKDGYIAMIVPHKERTFDKDRDRTTLNELIERHNKVKNYKYNVDEERNAFFCLDNRRYTRIMQIFKYECN